MRAAGRSAVAGAVLLLAAACSDGGSGAPPATTTAADASASATTSTAAAATTTTATTTTIPATTTPTTSPPRASFPDDLSAVAAITGTFTYPGSPIDAGAAQCIADGLVHVFGRTKAEQLGFGLGRWTLVGFSVALGPWNRPDSTAVVDTFRVCTRDWELLMVTTATAGADHLDGLVSRCVADAIDDRRAHDVFVTLLDRPDDGALPGAVADLERAYSGCLSPAQLTALDWNGG